MPDKPDRKKRKLDLNDSLRQEAKSLGKQPPQATEVERRVLGAILIDPEGLTKVMDLLNPDSFYPEAHQAIYRAALNLFEKSQPIDQLTIVQQLQLNGELEKAGGAYYITKLTASLTSAANAEAHARIVAEKHILRELIRVSTDVVTKAFDTTTDVFDLMDTAQQGLFAISEDNLQRSSESLGSLMIKVRKQIEEASNREEGLTGVPTGFTDLDRLTSGWQPSDLIIMAGRPGMGKCLGKGTRVVMYDGTLRKVEDVRVGDLLMGDDSTPRRVLSLARGREQMYWVRQNKGIDYRVNESHILSLKKSRVEGAGERGSVLNINVKDYLERSGKFKSNYKGYKVGVEFEKKVLPIHPYFLGLWLGDGTSSSVDITTQDKEVVAYLEDYAQQLNCSVTARHREGKTSQYAIVGGSRGHDGYSLQGALRELGVLNDKHIPQAYLTGSTQQRLELLAGLVDSDGHYLTQSNGYSITQKSRKLAEQIKYLCDTLGFRTSLATIASTGYETEVYRVRIYGDIDRVPVRIPHKQANPWRSRVDWQVTDIEVEKDIVDDYYGFVIDGNHLFLLEDMTVTHNTSFTLALARNAAVQFDKPVALFSLEMSNVQLATRLISLEGEIPGSKMRSGKLEDFEWTQLAAAMDSMANAKIFIDDTPGINIFELRAKCRRLKMQHDIQMIIIDYLQLMTGGGDKNNGNREQEISAISRSLKGLAKELHVPVIALSQLSRAVETRGGSKRPQLSDLRECVPGHTLVCLADGRRVPIRELVGKQPEVLCVDDAGSIQKSLSDKVWSVGIRPTRRLSLKSGRSIEATDKHRLLMYGGWERVKNIKVGDRIAIARELPEPEEVVEWSSQTESIDSYSTYGAHIQQSSTTTVASSLFTATNDLFWDEIVAITDAGEQEVFDLTVPGPASWLADGIVSHNSGAIEQDADIVSFIYRPEYYGIDEDEEGNSLTGVAEIIVAKHRNGATDTVKLKWIAEFAKFDNLNDGDFGDDSFMLPSAINAGSAASSGGGGIDGGMGTAGPTFTPPDTDIDDVPF